jgi:hypothetical protein
MKGWLFIMMLFTDIAYGGYFRLPLLCLGFILNYSPFVEDFSQRIRIYNENGEFLFSLGMVQTDLKKSTNDLFGCRDSTDTLIFSNNGKIEVSVCAEIPSVADKMRKIWQYCRKNNINTADMYMDSFSRNTLHRILITECECDDWESEQWEVIGMLKQATIPQ